MVEQLEGGVSEPERDALEREYQDYLRRNPEFTISLDTFRQYRNELNEQPKDVAHIGEVERTDLPRTPLSDTPQNAISPHDALPEKVELNSEESLQELLGELVPDLEEQLWNYLIPTDTMDLFVMAADLIEQALNVELTAQYESLTALTRHYAEKNPKEVIDLLRKVDLPDFDGGHVLEVGRSISYRAKNREELPNDFQFSMSAHHSSSTHRRWISLPYGNEDMSSFYSIHMQKINSESLAQKVVGLVQRSRKSFEYKSLEIDQQERPELHHLGTDVRELTDADRSRIIEDAFKRFSQKYPHHTISRRVYDDFLQRLIDGFQASAEDEASRRAQSETSSSAPTEFRHLTDSEIYGFVQENGQFQRMMEDRRIQAEMHRRMREDEEMRDRIRYELERRAAEDPNFRWPSGIPRGDAYGEIISRRRLDERSWGVPSRSEHDDYYRDDERLRGDIGFYYGGDHASGADKG